MMSNIALSRTVTATASINQQHAMPPDSKSRHGGLPAEREFMPTPLSLLLDVSALENEREISLRFKEIAKALLHSYYLRIEHQGTTTDFELLEIEFYLQKKDVHEDPFCHAHEDQQNSASWYFHRAPRRASSLIKPSIAPTPAHGYRGGTRKGLDLTFGTPMTSSFSPENPLKPCRGGILLRSMRMGNGTAQIISGPSLLVDKILSMTQSQNIAELVVKKLGGCLSAFPPSDSSSAWNDCQSRMYLIPRQLDSTASLASIYRSPRVGLDLSHPSVSPKSNNSRVVFVARPYRYFIYPSLLRVNGRCHTLVGLLLDHSNNSAENKAALIGPLSEVMAINCATVEKYLDDYADGFKNRSLSEYVGRSGKGVCSSPKLFMKLMGVLGRMSLLVADDT